MQTLQTERCQAAHHDEPAPCVQPLDAVNLDSAGVHSTACINHAAAVLATIHDSRALPGSAPGAVLDVYRLAEEMQAAAFLGRASA